MKGAPFVRRFSFQVKQSFRWTSQVVIFFKLNSVCRKINAEGSSMHMSGNSQILLHRKFCEIWLKVDVSHLRQKSLNWLTPELYPLDSNTTNVNFISAGYKLYPVAAHPCHGALADDKAEELMKAKRHFSCRFWNRVLPRRRAQDSRWEEKRWECREISSLFSACSQLFSDMSIFKRG